MRETEAVCLPQSLESDWRGVGVVFGGVDRELTICSKPP